MSNPRPRSEAIPPKNQDDLTRIDPFREDEDTGGDAAPPLFPYHQHPAPKPDVSKAPPDRSKEPRKR
jgi:hypothetical protein